MIFLVILSCVIWWLWFLFVFVVNYRNQIAWLKLGHHNWHWDHCRGREDEAPTTQKWCRSFRGAERKDQEKKKKKRQQAWSRGFIKVMSRFHNKNQHRLWLMRVGELTAAMKPQLHNGDVAASTISFFFFFFERMI